MLERAICGCDFEVAKFCAGTGIQRESNEYSKQELFRELLYKWKREITISEDDYANWMEMIKNYISIRTEGIMNGNRRNYYGECAAFIAAYGEVYESRGVYRGKQNIMQHYRAKYSRRRAFHEELRRYGMSK